MGGKAHVKDIPFGYVTVMIVMKITAYLVQRIMVIYLFITLHQMIYPLIYLVFDDLPIDLPIKNGDFPVPYISYNQMVGEVFFRAHPDIA